MELSLITYNVLFNQAYERLENNFLNEKPDIICLQEIETDELNLRKFSKSPFVLADYTNSFVKFGKIFGCATFYNPEKLEFIGSSSFELPRSFLEVFLVLWRGINKPRSVLKTEFIYKPLNKKITIYNLHFSPFATNGVRIKQLKETLNDIQNHPNGPTIICGDFNYPYGRKKFENLIHEHALQEATTNIFYTIDMPILKFFHYRAKLDYVLFKEINHVETRKIEIRYSDHFPILSIFSLS